MQTTDLIKKLNILKNKESKKLIKKIIDELNQNGIIINTLVEDLKKLRPYAVKEKRPVVAKAIRLIYEHIEEFETFTIPIPSDEDIVDENDDIVASDESERSTPSESLIYLMSLIENEEHRRNKQEIREFNEALKEYYEDYAL